MKIEHIALYVKDLETARDFLWKKPLAAAISPGRALEDISGENQDAASFNRSAAALVYCLHGGSLPPASDAAVVRGIYAPAWMDVGLWQIYELLCGCKSFLIRFGLPVAAKARRCPLFGSLTK